MSEIKPDWCHNAEVGHIIPDNTLEITPETLGDTLRNKKMVVKWKRFPPRPASLWRMKAGEPTILPLAILVLRNVGPTYCGS